jgi:SecD/SecF fusion protein
MSHATIQDRITERGRITGDFTLERVQELVRTLEAGSLPARLKETPLMEKTIGPSLGETNRRHGIQAAIWAGIAVAVFVLIYYGIAGGGMADVALALNLLFVLSAMALMQATFTLPGVAGLILTVGMAIDANVLIFERIREERDRGVIFKKALNAGYEKAFSTIMDANLTTLITCVILGFVGSEEVKGFAIVLGIGIVTSMFTALFVTRLVFNTLIVKGMLKDLSMRRLIHRPSIDWISLRSTFWPISIAVVALGMGLFVTQSTRDKEAVYDIEFLGGTSVQIDLKPGPEFEMSDEEVHRAITATDGESAVQWLKSAAGHLETAQAADGEVPGQFTLTSPELTGGQLATLMHSTVENLVERDGISAAGRTATFEGKSGELDLTLFQAKATEAARRARQAANRLRNARVQTIGETRPSANTGKSYEIATVVTNRGLVQEAILAVMGDKLKIQQAVNFTTVRDEELTKEKYFVVEAEDHYLSDVVGGDAHFDIRKFRGGVTIEVVLDEHEVPLLPEELKKRLREVGLSPEFEQYRTRESAVFPLGGAITRTDGKTGYRRFAVLAVDETMMYDDDRILWAEQLARTHFDQVEAALGSEKSLSKVVQFAPQIAGQTKNRAIFAIILALGAIVSYLWLRFGTKEYGLAAIVALIHDVAITLGLVALSHFLYATVVGSALAIDDFKIDLPMIAAILTVIGYSLNDTIVVFDRIRENRGRLGSLNPKLINNSINQTLARTVLTSITTFLVVAILYAFGGKGVHGFSFALLIGVVVGTYSSIGIATPLLYRPRLLRSVVAVIAALILIGVVFAEVGDPTWRLVLTGLIALICVVYLVRRRGEVEYAAAGQPAGA